MKKITPVFGPQEFFDGAPECATHATRSGGFYCIDGGIIKFVSDGIFNGQKVGAVAGNLIAERRIEEVPEDDEAALESLYWEFDSQRATKETDERLLFKGKLRYYAGLVAGKCENAAPKRWTVADQKAGRLPEVGAEFQTSIGKRKCVIKEGKFIFTVNDDAVEVFTIDSAMPLETPDEKAAREEDEFVTSITKCTATDGYSSGYIEGLRTAYRNLKGGKQ